MAWPAEAAQLSLTWMDNSNNEDGFTVERKTGTGGMYAQIGTVGPNVASYVDSGLAAGTTYCYRVLAFNAFGNSAYSNEACSTAPQNFSLAVVRAGTGNGTVTSAPAGITCGTSCSASYNSGTSVTLSAAAAAGSTFTGWSGGGCSGTSSCTLALTATTTVIATFNTAAPLTLTSLTPNLTAPRAPGTTITFTATASGGTAPYQSKWWLGDGTTWSVVQNWATGMTFAWTPTTPNPNYQFAIQIRSAGSTTDNVPAAGSMPFAIQAGAPLTLTNLTANLTAPQPPGTTITFTATASGGTAPYQSKWWLGDGTTWSVVQNWATGMTFAWTPTTPNPNYQFAIQIRSAGSTTDNMPAAGSLAFPVR